MFFYPRTSLLAGHKCALLQDEAPSHAHPLQVGRMSYRKSSEQVRMEQQNIPQERQSGKVLVSGMQPTPQWQLLQ